MVALGRPCRRSQGLGWSRIRIAPGQASSMLLGSRIGVGHRVPPDLYSLQGLGAGSQQAGEEAWSGSSLTNVLISISVVLPFPECHTSVVIQHEVF